MDRVADYLPEFAARGKAEITLQEVMTHRGGFPTVTCRGRPGPTMRGCGPRSATFRSTGRRDEAGIPRARRTSGAGDGDRSGHRPGLSRRDPQPGDGTAWSRRRCLRWRSAELQARCADTYAPEARDNSRGIQGGRDAERRWLRDSPGMAAFYQMLSAGTARHVRLFSPRLIAYVSRNHTGERGDHQMGGIPTHRRLGPRRPRRQRPHPRPWHYRRALDLRHGGVVRHPPGSIRKAAFVQLPDQLRVARSVAFDSAGPSLEPGTCGDRLTRLRVAALPFDRGRAAHPSVAALPIASAALGE